MIALKYEMQRIKQQAQVDRMTQELEKIKKEDERAKCVDRSTLIMITVTIVFYHLRHTRQSFLWLQTLFPTPHSPITQVGSGTRAAVA